MIKVNENSYKIETEALNNWLNTITGENVPLGEPRPIKALINDYSEATLPTEESFKEFVETYDGAYGRTKAILNRADNGISPQDWKGMSRTTVAPNENIRNLTIIGSSFYGLDLRNCDVEMLDLQHNHNMTEIKGLETDYRGESLSRVTLLDNAFRYNLEKLYDDRLSKTPFWFNSTIDLMTIAENQPFLDRYIDNETIQSKFRVKEAISDCTYTIYDPEEVIDLDAALNERFAKTVTPDMTMEEKLVAILDDARHVDLPYMTMDGQADHEMLDDKGIDKIHGLKFMLYPQDEQEAVCSGMSHLAKWMGEKAGIKVDLVTALDTREPLRPEKGNADKYFGLDPNEPEHANHMLVRTELPGMAPQYTDVMNMSADMNYALLSQDDLVKPSEFGGRLKLEPCEYNYALNSRTEDRGRLEDLKDSATDKIYKAHPEVAAQRAKEKRELLFAEMFENMERNGGLERLAKEIGLYD